ncbi:MAG: hypothetical protein JEZ12_11675 [Desulfobacterium sp.]|nr:hypothetical protein [Desulfobacterium sp.]
MKKVLIALLFWGLTLQASAATLNDANKLFTWAEETYPAIFSPAGTETIEADNFFCRFYSDTGTYYATLGNDVYIFSPMFGDSVITLGKTSDFIQPTEPNFKFTKDWLNGKTLYNVYFEDDDNKWEIATFTFTDTSLSAVSDNDENDRIDNAPYAITNEGYLSFTAYDENEGKEETDYIKGLELTNDYLSLFWTDEIEDFSGSTPNDEYFYFDLQTAQNFVTTKNADIAANSEMVTIEGKVTFVDSDGNPIAAPSDAAIRITSDNDQAKDHWGRGFTISVNSDGTFSKTKSMYENSYKEGHTFSIAIFKNHIDVDELNWDSNEDAYKHLGNNVSYGAWKEIIVSPQDFQDRSTQ